MPASGTIRPAMFRYGAVRHGSFGLCPQSIVPPARRAVFQLFSRFSVFLRLLFSKTGLYYFLIITARWCNGSTSDSGSFSLGSSPGRAATFLSTRSRSCDMPCVFFAFDSGQIDRVVLLTCFPAASVSFQSMSARMLREDKTAESKSIKIYKKVSRFIKFFYKKLKKIKKRACFFGETGYSK